MRSRTTARAALLLLLSATAGVRAQTLPERFLSLVRTPGMAGSENDVRSAVKAQLPPWAKPRVDRLGNLIVTLGSGKPHLALVAALDERGYVVSRITDDGYLRLHRPTGPFTQPLGEQLFLGQPVRVRTAAGRWVPGVTATPSTHLSRLQEPVEVERIKAMEDLWVDVGAASAAEVAALGIRMLDPVSLRERGELLAAGRVAGVETRLRGGAQALIEVLRSYASEPAVKGTLTFAWVAQSQMRGRGLAHLARTLHPDRAVVIARENRDGDESTPPKPAGWEDVTIAWKSLSAVFPDTPVETVDTNDIAALARDLAIRADLPRATAKEEEKVGGPPRIAEPAAAPASSPSFQVLGSLIETYGVSGHEAPVRETVRKLLPAWTKPEVDEKGNLTVRFGGGGKGGRELVFLAHLDEVGFEIAALRPDGSATLRVRGGVFLSLYEGHPVLVQTARGPVSAVLAPRSGYAGATASQPKDDDLTLYFGTKTLAETTALGIEPGQALTVRKRFVELGTFRATGRSMDDRVGSTALLLALRALDPAQVHNRVTFAWTVGEEIGLDGARDLATRLHPDVAYAIDTFVSTDTPLDLPYLAHAPLGRGAVLRGMDSVTIVPAETISRIVALAKGAKIPLQIGVTQGGTDASAFSAGGAIDVGLSWPGRYSHSPVEVMDRRDLDSLVALIVRLARED